MHELLKKARIQRALKKAENQVVQFGCATSKDGNLQLLGFSASKNARKVGEIVEDGIQEEKKEDARAAFGTATVSGNVLRLVPERKVPNLRAIARKALQAHHITMKVVIAGEEEDGDDAPAAPSAGSASTSSSASGAPAGAGGIDPAYSSDLGSDAAPSAAGGIDPAYSSDLGSGAASSPAGGIDPAYSSDLGSGAAASPAGGIDPAYSAGLGSDAAPSAAGGIDPAYSAGLGSVVPPATDTPAASPPPAWRGASSPYDVGAQDRPSQYFSDLADVAPESPASAAAASPPADPRGGSYTQGPSGVVPPPPASPPPSRPLPVPEGGLRVGRELGRGNFGSVRELETEAGGTRLVIKTGDDAAREARAYEQIGEHPNIVRSYGVHRVGGAEGLVMERVTGGSAREAIERLRAARDSGAVSQTEFWAALQHMASGLLRGLAHLESLGLVHGDIKSDNLMIDAETLEPKLVDVGLLTEAGQKIRGFHAGASAPEVAAREERTAAPNQDVAALGQLLHVAAEGDWGRWGGPSSQSRSIDPDQQAMAARSWRRGSDPRAMQPEAPGAGAAAPGRYAAGYESSYVDFMNQLMHPDPAKRLTPAQALQHPFLAEGFQHEEREVLSAMRKAIGAPPPPPAASSPDTSPAAAAAAGSPAAAEDSSSSSSSSSSAAAGSPSRPSWRAGASAPSPASPPPAPPPPPGAGSGSKPSWKKP